MGTLEAGSGAARLLRRLGGAAAGVCCCFASFAGQTNRHLQGERLELGGVMTLPQHNLRDDRIHAIVEDFEREHGPDAKMSRKEFEAAYGELCPSELADRDARSRVLHAFHLKYKDTYGKSNNMKSRGRRKPRPRRSKEAEERRERRRAERAASAERATDSEAEGATDGERATDTEAERAANAEPAADTEAERAADTKAPAASSAHPFKTAPRWLEPIREDPEPARDEPAFVRVSRLTHNGLSSEVVDAPRLRAGMWKARGLAVEQVARARSQHQWDGARGWPCEASTDRALGALAATVQGRARSASPMHVPLQRSSRRRRRTRAGAAPPPTPTADEATNNWPPMPKRLPDAP